MANPYVQNAERCPFKLRSLDINMQPHMQWTNLIPEKRILGLITCGFCDYNGLNTMFETITAHMKHHENAQQRVARHASHLITHRPAREPSQITWTPHGCTILIEAEDTSVSQLNKLAR